jgi:hypothetical protein
MSPTGKQGLSKHKTIGNDGIKHCMQRQGTGSAIPMVRALLRFEMNFYLEIVYSAKKYVSLAPLVSNIMRLKLL